MAYATQTETIFEPQTQKAKSVNALKYANFKTPAFQIRSAKYYESHPGALGELVGKFVRPCPMTPRHGFVDSRPINSLHDAENIVRETLAADPDGEIIAMPYIASEFSAIYTSGVLAIGPGNDGATLGNNSKMIPVLGFPSRNEYEWKNAMQYAGITEAPYCEILFRDRNYSSELSEHIDANWEAYFVQLRNGPKLPAHVDYIPRKMKIEKIVFARGENGKLFREDNTEIDLLAWESEAKELAKQSGLVVYHPNGNLASHCAVHCVINNVPVVCSFKPEIGQTIEQTADKVEPKIEKMKAGFVLGCNAKMNYTQASLAMLCGAHLTSVWLGKQDFLLGFAMGCAYRLTIAAGLGEYRHRRHVVNHGEGTKKSRNAVYRGCWNKVLTPSTRQRFLKALWSFQNEHWGSSFGGKKWYAFCAFSASTFNALLANDAKRALAAFNQTVHAAHNGGWAFDKFLKESEMSQAAVNPCMTLLRCAPDLYSALIAEEQNPGLEKWFKYRCSIDVDVEINENSTMMQNEYTSCHSCGYQYKTKKSNCPSCGTANQQKQQSINHSNPSNDVAIAEDLHDVCMNCNQPYGDHYGEYCLYSAMVDAENGLSVDKAYTFKKQPKQTKPATEVEWVPVNPKVDPKTITDVQVTFYRYSLAKCKTLKHGGFLHIQYKKNGQLEINNPDAHSTTSIELVQKAIAANPNKTQTQNYKIASDHTFVICTSHPSGCWNIGTDEIPYFIDPTCDKF